MPPFPDVDTSTRALFRRRDFTLFWASRWSAILASQIISVALGWQVYVIARQGHDVRQAAFAVSLIGLVSFAPVFFLALPAGETADRYDRRRILLACFAAEIAVTAALLAAAALRVAGLPLLLSLAAAFGASRSFFSPASTALGPMLVPRELLPRAVAWNSLAWQSASIAGPAVGGLLIAASLPLAYGVAAGLQAVALSCVLLIRSPAKPQVQPGSRLELMREGLAYVWRNKLVFGSISLDLFAVLLGGATALLPVFARDVLHVGAQGFGVLRAAPALGATIVALWLASHQIRRRAGPAMFVAVGLFGAATVVFGLSRLVWLSVLALATLGAADSVSVYVRQILVQLATPDHMRGRVSTVSSLFIGASNELGEFESGVAARLFGPVAAVVLGGVGALGVTGLWAVLFPSLRQADSLTDPAP